MSTLSSKSLVHMPQGDHAQSEHAARRRAQQPHAHAESDRAMRIRRLQWLSAFMDSAIEIPGIRFRVGLDPLIGLLPGAGDLISDAISLYIVYEGWRLGATKGQLARMIGNVAIDTLIGAVPVAGDVFDFAFKANARNLRILGIPSGQTIREVHADSPRSS